MKTVVFAYGDFGCVGIEQLQAAGYELAMVFTYPDTPGDAQHQRSVAALCQQHALPLRLVEEGGAALPVEAVAALRPDYLFSFYWRALLPPSLLSLARRGAFNMHGSLLPQYRGRAPLNWVLVRGETMTGVTLHHMVARADAGDIVGQQPVAIDYEDTAASLQRKLLGACAQLLSAQLPLIANGTAARTPQDLAKGSYFGRRRPEDGRIDWALSAETIRNLVRAVSHPFPGAFTQVAGQTLLVWEAAVVQAPHAAHGTVISVDPLVVACGEGALRIKAELPVAQSPVLVEGIRLGQ